MLPRKMPLMACCMWDGLLQDLELPVLDLLHARLVPRVALLREGELAEGRVEVLDLLEAGLDVVAPCLVPRLADRLCDDEDSRVRLRRELIGRDTLLLHRFFEGGVGGFGAGGVPGGAGQHAFRGRAGVTPARPRK